MDCERTSSNLSVAEGSSGAGDGAPSEALKPPSPRPSPVHSDVDKIVTLKAQMATVYLEPVAQFHEAPARHEGRLAAKKKGKNIVDVEEKSKT